MTRISRFRIKPNELRWTCNPNSLGFRTTDEIPCCQDIIGQERALDAIRLGLEIESPGYNIFVSGLTGTGKTTTLKSLLQSMQHGKNKLQDICYVHNFRASDMPVCVKLPAGEGGKFKRYVADMLRTLKKHIPRVIEGEAYGKRQKQILEELQGKRSALAKELEKKIADRNFRLLEVQYGPYTRPVVLPVIGDEPVEMDKLAALLEEKAITEADVERIKKDHDFLGGEMEAFMKIARDLDRQLADKISWLEKENVSPIINTCVEELKERFEMGKVHHYLDELREYCIDNIDVFKETVGEQKERDEPAESFVEFEVNLLVDNSRAKEAPVIIETSPAYGNLFGSIDRVHEGRGEYRSDQTMIRAGSLVRANGGYLVLSLTDVIEEPAVWPALKRALKNQKVAIQSFDSVLFLSSSGIKPEPIEIDVKVALVGDAYSYNILYNYDEDFKKIFKVKAEFDTEMPNEGENLGKYSLFVKSIIDKEEMRAFHKTAVAAIAEEGSRIAGRQDKLTTKFSDVADIVREANYWAGKDNARIVKAKHVAKAIDERVKRVNLVEEKISEMLNDGTILIDIDGAKIGQVNGLSVYDVGDYSFGKPSRITVETAMGRAGLINIEREADLSGKTHNKGVLIIEGFFRRKFAQERPLTMSSSICFEQSYSGIDGDSASSTEIYGLLSSLGEIPLRQDIAVTGSVNQKGEIQPIGGVNDKIEGFFDICKHKGLTGSQGVMIPKLNENDLMLKNEVIQAVKSRKFHIYSIETIDEGIEVLAGMKSGKRLENGEFEKKSVNYLVDKKLTKFAEHIREFEAGDEKE